MSRIYRSSYMIAALTAAFVLSSCASKPEYYEPLAAAADPSTEIGTLSTQIKEAKEKQIDVLAPTHFDRAIKEEGEAEKLRSENKDNGKILDAVAKARAHLKKATEVAALSQASLASVTEARQRVLKANALVSQPTELSEADKRFKNFTRDVENGNVNMDRNDKTSLQEAYRAIELKAITFNYLGSTRNIINVAKSEGAEKTAPKTWATANSKYAEAEAVTMNDPYNDARIKPLAEAANRDASLLLSFTRSAKVASKMSPEELAIYNHNQELLLKNSKIQTEEEKTGRMAKERQLSAQNAQLSVLERQAMVDRNIAEVRKEFSPEEADVFKDGDNVLIRLKSISFKKNDASLRSKQIEMLKKVQDAVAKFSPSKVVVEGHTDSTGTAALNKTLSEERARVVESYLVNNGMSPEQVEAIGYGFEKPLAPNKSAKGRAQNRRIDVVIEL